MELRVSVGLSLDDALEVMRRCVKPDLSRSALYRCWKRYSVGTRPKTSREKPGVFQTDRPAGFIHIDVKYLTALGGKRDYAYVAIDRATRFVYVEILPDRKGATAAAFLKRFLEAFPYPVHTILTDNPVLSDCLPSRQSKGVRSSPIASLSTKRTSRKINPLATIPSTGSVSNSPSNIASHGPSGRKPTAWLSASTDGSRSISTMPLKTTEMQEKTASKINSSVPIISKLSSNIIIAQD